jgi:hypothetical protein
MNTKSHIVHAWWDSGSFLRVRQHLNEVLGEKWTGWGGPVPWTSTVIRTQSIGSLFILWGSYLKCLVYVISVKDVAELQPYVCRMLVKQSEGRLGFLTHTNSVALCEALREDGKKMLNTYCSNTFGIRYASQPLVVKCYKIHKDHNSEMWPF